MTSVGSPGNEMTAVGGGGLGPVRRGPRLSDQVAEKLLEYVLSSKLRPGDRLPSERELGERFEVSRTVIREATRMLAARGVIEVRSGTGLSVAAVDASAVAETMNLFLRGRDELPYEQVFEVRALIEIQTAGLAAERRTEAELDELRRLHERFVEQTKQRRSIAEVDTEFHRVLARATHNPLYLIMLDSIKDILLEVREQVAAYRDDQVATIDLHAAILQAVESRDALEAREAMERHLLQGLEIWRKVGQPVARPSARRVSD